MSTEILTVCERLIAERSLSPREYEKLILERTDEAAAFLREAAVKERVKYYGRDVYVRGLIEISNICKNDCLYCGIRASNKSVQRYRLRENDIISCCRSGYELGFRTFVLQGGEDSYYNDARLCKIIEDIKSEFADCAVTISLGERSRKSYERLYAAGADRYLLRHETATPCHYSALHPEKMSLAKRMRCLDDLKDIGYQVGCGFMVGSPYQTAEHIARDLKFIEEFKPHMCGIGPFIPHEATPFATFAAGTVELTCYLLSIIRIILPKVLLPATTALGSILHNGREMGILAGANVVMPNLSPEEARGKYELYNNKLYTGAESAQAMDELKARINAIGYNVVCHRGDAIK